MRNSSLVERSRAEDITGLKHATEATELARLRAGQLVGERSLRGEVTPVRGDGLQGSENPGMSSERQVRILPA